MTPPGSHVRVPALRRQRRAAAVLGSLVLALAAVLAHASWARSQREEAQHPEVRLLPSPSLVLSTRSRWLRHPMLSEPGAAFQDAPAFLDADPAAALHTPPRALFRSTGEQP